MTQTDDLKELAPTGRLRGGLVIAPAKTGFFAIKDGQGAPHGVTVDLLRFLSGETKLPLDMQLYDNSGQVTDAVASGACDVAFMPQDAARAARVAFGPRYLMIESTYLVPAGSAIQSIEEVNRAGVRVIAIANTTTMRSARRSSPNASVREVPSVDAMMRLARTGEGDAFALSKDSFASLLPDLRGARVLAGNFQETGIAVAVPPGRPRALALVTALIDEAKRNGTVRRALDAAGYRDEPVAP
ncbi:MAG TPA: transporter substrate-binding domain-containing protein [Pseudolabrys sp.]|uniref:transporter substrate-binding domain-containing protein n=1 Tax=Pseudolabrys sp. TaxID=1960880 RepID=UPI002DDCFB22|nr:transporter substrate-binding domain-containing protein [Pseudolabrys sp.]HEV2630624.1 transporter substrate-binding domain-containing protein [Pseudolabrys sp.]